MIKQIFTLLWKKKGQNTFIIIEIILAFLILFAVFSLVSKFLTKYNTPLGFNYENTGIIEVDFAKMIDEQFADDSEGGYDEQKYKDGIALMHQNLMQTDGIVAVSFTNEVAPYAGSNWSTSNEQSEDSELISYRNTELVITDQYYADVYDLNLVDGKWFDANDINGKYLPIVVNQKFVDEFYPSQGSIVGKQMDFWGDPRTIVGVVDHFKYFNDFEDEGTMMFPYLNNAYNTGFIQFKFDQNINPNWELALQKTLEQEFRGVDFSFYKLDDARWSINRQYWAPMIGLLSLCAFLVINIAMGLFGIMQYNIKQRRGEIGLRKAIGATNGAVRTQFIAETMLLTALALFIGFLIAVQVPLLNLFDIKDGTLYFGMALSAAVIISLVFICSLVPSSLAAKIAPAVALHDE